MRDTGNIFTIHVYVLCRWSVCFLYWPYLKLHDLPASGPSVLKIQSMFNLFFCLFLNRVQLAFIALPFHSRVGANLFSLDIKGQFLLLFRKYFFLFFLTAVTSVHYQLGDKFKSIVMCCCSGHSVLRNVIFLFSLANSMNVGMAFSVSCSTLECLSSC